MRRQKPSASSSGDNSRKIEIPTLKIPPDATKEEVEAMTRKFIAELKGQNLMPKEKKERSTEQTSKPASEKS